MDGPLTIHEHHQNNETTISPIHEFKALQNVF
jgi:hypothetical protein